MPNARGAVACAVLCLACGNELSAPGSEAAVSVADFGARGDGATLDHSAIQAAVDAVPARGTVRFPPGTYRIPGDKGIKLKDDVRLDLGDAVLVATNVEGARCRLFHIEGGKNIVITGGTLQGSRGGRPEWAMGILASDAEDLVIENVTIRDFYFDGILLTGNRGCRRVSLRRVVSENNRRTGLAIVHAYDVTVQDSTFRGTRGQSPAAGANCEPNGGEEVRNVSFKGCTFAGNAGTGLYAHRGKGKLVQNVSVTDSVVSDNGQGIAIVSVEGTSIVNNRVTGQRSKGKSGIVVGDASGARISGNQLEDNFRGIFSAGAARTDIRGNTVVGMAPGTVAGGDEASGIVCLGLPGFKDEACDVVQNTVRRCAGSGIVAQLVSRVRIHDNVVEETGRRGILLLSSTRSDVKGNEVSRNGLETPARYDAIELSQAANDNTITSNTIRLSPSVRQAIGVGPGCRGNKVDGNVVLPY